MTTTMTDLTIDLLVVDPEWGIGEAEENLVVLQKLRRDAFNDWYDSHVMGSPDREALKMMEHYDAQIEECERLIERMSTRNDEIADAADMLRSWVVDMRAAMREVDLVLAILADDPEQLRDVDMLDIKDTFRQLAGYPHRHLNKLIDLSQ